MIPDITYLPPIMITVAKDYKNMAWRSDTDFAVQINAGNQQINFDNCIFVGGHECIVKGWGGTKVKFTNCSFYGSTPVDQWARSFNGYEVMGFEMYNCYTEQTGGILIERWVGNLDAPLKVMYNQFKNIDNRKKDGTQGGSKHSGLMLKDFTLKGGLTNIEIAWNEIINEFGKSLVEDNFNLFNAKGTLDKPIKFHDNFVWGALPLTTDDTAYTGTGFTTDSGGGSNTFDSVTSYVLGYNNVFLDCQNSSINYAIGHDLHFDNTNLIMNSGLAPDGTKFKKAWAGCAIFDSNLTAQGANVNDPIFANNTIKGNTIGSMSWGQNYPFKDRQDEMDDRGTGQWQNRMPRGGNTYLPDGSVTPATVAAQYPIWQKKLKDNGITIGVGGTVKPTVNLSLKVGQSATGIITPLNVSGIATTFKAGTLKAISSDITVATISVSADEKTISIKGLKVGTATGTVSLTTNGGKLISTTFTMEVLAVIPTEDIEATSIKIEFVIP